MANSYTQIALETGIAEGAGIGQVVFPFTFEYLNTADIKVIIVIDPAAATPVWTAILPLNKTLGGAYDSNGVDAVNKKIVLNALPSATSGVGGASEIRIYRSTTGDSLVDFQGGSRISEADLDTAYRQGLFAAQEVAENASTTGVAAGASATLTSGSVQLAHMDDESVDSDQYVDRSIDTAHIALNAVGEPELATTLDLSDHVITLPAMSLDLGNDFTIGILPEARGGTGRTAKPSGTILECVSGPCLGKTQAAADGSYPHTLPNAGSSGYAMTSSYADIPGSIFGYRASLEATKICYELNFTVSKEGTLQSKAYSMFKLYIGAANGGTGGTFSEVPFARFTVGNGDEYGTRIHFKWTFPVNDGQYTGSTMADVGAVSSWGASTSSVGTRYIKLKGREFINSTDIRHSKVNGVYLWSDTGTGSADSLSENTSVLSCPVITVTSIK